MIPIVTRMVITPTIPSVKFIDLSIISFAIFADSLPEERFIIDDEINLGEIIISLDKTEEQSKNNNVTFDSELYYLISHGILHLLGFDHQTQEEYDFMVEKQNIAKAVVL